ncbi:hypothetical protein [Desulfovibrio litoralis]|uniref:Uncharacterized protein n=1 Tax=Desulfovibrio litoralis DSM 11393 TaxID=1121455 RepID=A0A1M7TR51_9BACT|nr:hypothetical protein [Desulfovibrio litoralis]SHN73146.1 hypothetical protein SAMN02745728_02385 [Desulfovibrio litoralis DSM 11393]
MISQQQNNNFNNCSISPIKDLISFIPTPGKIYLFFHAIICLLAVYFSIAGILKGDWAIFLLLFTIPTILISIGCLSIKTKYWLIPFISALIGAIFVLGVSVVNNVWSNLWGLLLFYCYSLLSVLSKKITQKGEQARPTLDLLNKKLSFGLTLFLIYAVWRIGEGLWLLKVFSWNFIEIWQLGGFNQLPFIINLAMTFVFIATLYGFFQRKKRLFFISMIIIAGNSLINFLPYLFRGDFDVLFSKYLIALYILPLVFLYYLLTAKDAEQYFPLGVLPKKQQ